MPVMKRASFEHRNTAASPMSVTSARRPSGVCRIDAVDAHAETELAGFHRSDPRHAVNRGFGARIDRDAREGDRCRNRGDVDDGAALAGRPARAHGTEGVLHAEHGANDIDVAHPPRVLGLDLGDQRRDLDAGIVDQNVVAAEGCDGLGNRPLPLSVVGDVELDEARGDVFLRDSGCAGTAGLFQDVGDHDRGAGSRQRLRDGRADSSSTAGDQGVPACKALPTHDALLRCW